MSIFLKNIEIIDKSFYNRDERKMTAEVERLLHEIENGILSDNDIGNEMESDDENPEPENDNIQAVTMNVNNGTAELTSLIYF